jgi:hypothetical protein
MKEIEGIRKTPFITFIPVEILIRVIRSTGLILSARILQDERDFSYPFYPLHPCKNPSPQTFENKLQVFLQAPFIRGDQRQSLSLVSLPRGREPAVCPVTIHNCGAGTQAASAERTAGLQPVNPS